MSRNDRRNRTSTGRSTSACARAPVVWPLVPWDFEASNIFRHFKYIQIYLSNQFSNLFKIIHNIKIIKYHRISRRCTHLTLSTLLLTPLWDTFDTKFPELSHLEWGRGRQGHTLTPRTWPSPSKQNSPSSKHILQYFDCFDCLMTV